MRSQCTEQHAGVHDEEDPLVDLWQRRHECRLLLLGGCAGDRISCQGSKQPIASAHSLCLPQTRGQRLDDHRAYGWRGCTLSVVQATRKRQHQAPHCMPSDAMCFGTLLSEWLQRVANGSSLAPASPAGWPIRSQGTSPALFH